VGRYLKILQVQERLQASRSWVYRALADGLLPSVRIGGITRVPEEALEAYLRKRTRRPRAAAATKRDGKGTAAGA
jgi:excisionase family DNA binding protein